MGPLGVLKDMMAGIGELRDQWQSLVLGGISSTQSYIEATEGLLALKALMRSSQCEEKGEGRLGIFSPTHP